MKNKCIVVNLILLILIIFQVVDSATDGRFGNVTLQIDTNSPVEFGISRALLYRNVSILYDSTAFVQSDDNIEVLYYPQLADGKQNILRLIAERLKNEEKEFFDIFFNLGDSIPAVVQWTDEKGRIFFAMNGIARTDKPTSNHINGKIELNVGKKSEAVSGNFDLNFEFPLINDFANPNKIHIKGVFDVPVGEYEETSLATVTSKQKIEARYKKNILVAVVVGIFLLAIFGLK